MITPRTSRLVRVANLHTFRDAVVALACEGAPMDARDRLVVVPTRAAAAHLVRSIENRMLAGGLSAGASAKAERAVMLPDFIIPDELPLKLAERLPDPPSVLSTVEREVLLGAACRAVMEAGIEPPFRLRPGLVVEILRFYDTLRRNGKDVNTFDRLALSMLEPDAAHDRGAARLVRQTQFLSAVFRRFEEACVTAGRTDEHMLRQHVMASAAPRPWKHIVITVGDQAVDPHGLCTVDWDLVARLPRLERLDVVVTEAMLAGAFHERIHARLPGIEETRFSGPSASGPGRPVLWTRRNGQSLTWMTRDREEEVALFARRVRRAVRAGEGTALDRIALVVNRPLPYVYVAREVLRSAGIPCQTFDALPLAAEPYAAALASLMSFVTANFSRGSGIAVLRSPHFQFRTRSEVVLRAEDTAALGKEGGRGKGEGGRAAEVLRDIARELLPLRSPAPAADHLAILVGFLARHERLPGPDDPLRVRQLRARAAILGTLTSFRDAYTRFDSHVVGFDEVAALLRRAIEEHTFAPRTGGAGVHLVDADSARFGDFDDVQLAGLVEGEWPGRPRRSIFYSAALLRELGWPAETERLNGARAAFVDLLRLPSERLVVSSFSLEDDSLVTPSPLLDEVDRSELEVVDDDLAPCRVFEHEALALDPPEFLALSPAARRWAERRFSMPSGDDPRFRGSTRGHTAPAWSLSGLERYQDCPFKFFAADVLGLEEPAEDASALSPQVHGRFVHEVFQRFFEEWDRRGERTITSDRVDEAREVFADVAAPLLARLPDADAALERARLFGSAVSVGLVDVVLGIEASRGAPVRERWLEHRFEGEFLLGGSDGRRAPLKGVADRIDLLDEHRLRVIDYKSGYAPAVSRALQVPIYALCAQEELAARDGRHWRIDEAAYVAFAGKKALVPVVKQGAGDADDILSAARARLLQVIDGISRGEFPPQPHDPVICGYCAYASVCRKDYVEHDGTRT